MELVAARGVYLSLRSLRARALSAVGREDEAAAEYASLFPEQDERQSRMCISLSWRRLKRNDPRAALVQASAADEFWQAFDTANPAHAHATALRSKALRAVSLRQEN